MSRGNIALAEAREWIGTPVVWEQSVKGRACDCRGLVSGVARELGFPEAAEIEARVNGYARGRIDQAALIAGMDRLFDRVDDAQPGDILALRIRKTVQHLAIHAGVSGGYPRMIHALMGDPCAVVEVPICGFWNKRIAGIWRWRETAGEA